MCPLEFTREMQMRDAGPQDAPFLAQSVLIAGRAHVARGIWEVILGGAEEETLRFLRHLTVTQIPHLSHYSCSLIALDDASRPIGSLGGYDPGIAGYRALRQALPEVFGKMKLSKKASDISEEQAA